MDRGMGGALPLEKLDRSNNASWMNVLYVPTITKNLVLVGQIVDQGMRVRFTHLGCFIE